MPVEIKPLFLRLSLFEGRVLRGLFPLLFEIKDLRRNRA